MKILRFIAPAFAGLAFLAFGPTANAQFCLPVSPDFPIAGQGNTQNTGNDVSTHFGDPFEVMCWDDPGNQAFFGWDFGYGGLTGVQPITGNGIGPVEDPDIVVDPNGNGCIAIVYRVFDGANWRIYYEEHCYDVFNNVFNLVTGPTVIDNNFGFDCTSPNIDIQQAGSRMVVTWEEASRIWGRAGVLTGGMSANTMYVSSCTGDGAEPDVAVSVNQVAFTYIGNSGTNLWVQNTSLGNVFAGAPGPCTGVILRSLVWPGEQFFGPRVAMQAGSNVNEVVVHYTDGAHNFIYGYNSSTGYLETHINLVCPPISMVDYGNMRPAVAWYDADIIVVWDHDDGWNVNGPFYLGMEREVVANQLDFNGNVMNCSCVSVVNQTYNPGDGNQRTASVAGRYSGSYANMLYTWVNDGNNRIEYKRSFFTNVNLKKDVDEVAEATESMSVYPNPFSDAATINVTLAEGETAQALQVIDITGKVVGAFNVNGLTEGNYNFQLQDAISNIPAGIYMVRFTTDQSSKTLKVTKQ